MSLISSTIIRHIELMQDTATTSMAYFYFDFRDKEKQNCCGILASLLVQFSVRSDGCCDILSRLYSEHGNGLWQPSDRTLLNCLKEMLTLGRLGATYIIVDAIDECPTISGTPSPCEKVLDLVTDLVSLRNPNLRLCVTSRPEADIWTVLLPLRPHSVSLHNEMGQLDVEVYCEASGKLDFYFLVLIALFLLATSKKSSLRKKYWVLVTRHPLYFSWLFQYFSVLFYCFLRKHPKILYFFCTFLNFFVLFDQIYFEKVKYFFEQLQKLKKK